MLHLSIVHSTKYLSNNILNNILVSNTELVGNLAILPPLSKGQHCPVVVGFYVELKDDSNSANVRLSNEGKYAAIDEELERINWESIFQGQMMDQCYETFPTVTNNLVELYAPLTTRQEEVVSGCKSRLPISLMKRRSDAWEKIREGEDRLRTTI